MTYFKILVLFALSVLVLFQVACTGKSKQMEQAEQANLIIDSDSASLGIETIAMRHTAAGNMLDFRFRVLEPEKAMPMFRRDILPYLIDENTGKSLKVTDTTKVGPMRPTSRNPIAGKTYFMFFHNPRKFTKVGDKVTVVVGEHRIENLVVR